jgi:probable inorganic polyphosphate/ATP-NAD kinase
MKKENLLLPAKVKKVGLVAKINGNLVKNARILREILARYGVQILFENAAAKHLNLKEGSNLQGFEVCELAHECDFLISLGGDGTIISLCRNAAEISPFVLGIHAGRLGFLTDITMNECEKFFAEFFDGKFEVETPFMLDVFLHKKSGEILHKIAFNDAVIVGEKVGSMTHVEAFWNEKYFNAYFGDGVIVSTPVGSTGYNMSAGGAITYPLSEVFLVTPVCSHSLTQRPVVLPRGFEIKFKTSSAAVLVIDGQERYKMGELESVSMTLSANTARLIRHVGRDYFQILKEKLHWGYND